jgi:hypothetical protein
MDTNEDDRSNIEPHIYFYVGIILYIVATIYFIFFSPVFKIKHVIVEGEPSGDLNHQVEAFKGRNILFIGNLANELKNKELDIKTVRIYRGLPDTIKISFSPREQAIIWSTDGKNYLIDEEGIDYKEISDQEKLGLNLPIVIDRENVPIKLGAQAVSSQFLSTIKKLTENCFSKTQEEVDRFEVGETTFQIEVITKSKIKIIFDTLRNIDDQLDTARDILTAHRAEIKEYLDVRVDGWVYYK